MTIDDLIRVADKGYGPDGTVFEYHEGGEEPRDTLAQFVAIELRETFNADATSIEQLDEAIRVMESAREEINGVTCALWNEKQQRIPRAAVQR